MFEDADSVREMYSPARQRNEMFHVTHKVGPIPMSKTIHVYQEMFTKIHEAGAVRHPLEWMHACHVGANALRDTGHRVDDPALRAVVSLVTLKMLDWLRPSGMSEEPTDDNIKTVLSRLPIVPDNDPPIIRSLQGVPDRENP